MTVKRTKPESLRLKGISPAITVNDVEKSLHWYRDVVGFHCKETWEDEGTLTGVELVAGSQSLMLVQDDWAKGRDRVKGVGIRLMLMTTQELDDIAEAIKERGGTLESEPADTGWGSRAFALKDPDGFLLTIFAPTGAES